MKKLIFQVFFLAMFLNSFSQGDTLVYAEGNIISLATKAAVVAKISYRSEPYGSMAGFLSGSSFSFPLFDKHKYSIVVEAPGYAPSKFLIDPDEANSDHKVIKNIELGLPSSANNIAEETHTAGKVMRLENLNFDLGTAKINSSSYAELDRVVKMLGNNPKMVIQLEGHTEPKGNPQLNLKLSQDRADAVRNYLVSKGAKKKSIKTKAFGGTQPLSREDTEEAHAMNRRVELRILEN